MSQIPVVFIVFNRPGCTSRAFEVIRKIRPAKLFIVADGPRPDHPSDVVRCSEVRDVVKSIDWPCEVHRNYAESNLGLKQRVSSGLNWVFTEVERAIILEDDCIAHEDFFTFCEELLDRYAEDDKVSVITGNNFQDGNWRGEGSYYFSKYNHCWGWATWRRAWTLYDGNLSFWPGWRGSKDWVERIPDRVERRYWEEIFDSVYDKKIDSWSYPWTAALWLGGGLTATPNVNLVSNIGFGENATHTTSATSKLADMPIQPLGSLRHPDQVVHNESADTYAFESAFGGRKLRVPWSWLSLLASAVRFLYRYISRRLI